MVGYTSDRRTRQLRAERLGPGWAALRRRVLAEERRCRMCGKPAAHVDHIVPLRRGGRSDHGNLQSLCRPCHEVKSLGEQPPPLSRLAPSSTTTWAAAWQIADRLGVSASTV